MVAPARHHQDRPPRATFRRVTWPADLPTVRRLFEEYRDWLADHRDTSPEAESRVKSGLSLVDQLIAQLPGPYGPPRGEILLWFEDGEQVACGALRELAPNTGELKRIYVRPDYRGKAFGHPFVRAFMGRARELGYDRLRVDTLPTMAAAIEFYQELGFYPIPAFWPHPVTGALFFERKIDRET